MQTIGISACKWSPAEMCVICPVRLCEMISQASVPVFVASNGLSLSVVATVVFMWGFSPLWSCMGWEINCSGIRHVIFAWGFVLVLLFLVGNIYCKSKWLKLFPNTKGNFARAKEFLRCGTAQSGGHLEGVKSKPLLPSTGWDWNRRAKVSLGTNWHNCPLK